MDKIDNFDLLSFSLIDGDLATTDHDSGPTQPNYSTSTLLSSPEDFHFRPMPSTPSKRQKIEVSEPFSNTCPVAQEANPQLITQQLPEKARKHFNLEHAYKTPNGNTHTLLKKVTDQGEQDACLLMLWTDIFRKTADGLPLPDNALSQLGRHRSTEGTLVNHAKTFGIDLTPSDLIPSESPIPVIQRALSQSAHPLIISIDHPKIGDCWIMVDEINTEGKTLYIRSPYTGQAHTASFADAEAWFESGCERAFFLSHSE